jgi:hypothetical protein
VVDVNKTMMILIPPNSMELKLVVVIMLPTLAKWSDLIDEECRSSTGHMQVTGWFWFCCPTEAQRNVGRLFVGVLTREIVVVA